MNCRSTSPVSNYGRRSSSETPPKSTTSGRCWLLTPNQPPWTATGASWLMRGSSLSPTLAFAPWVFVLFFPKPNHVRILMRGGEREREREREREKGREREREGER